MSFIITWDRLNWFIHKWFARFFIRSCQLVTVRSIFEQNEKKEPSQKKSSIQFIVIFFMIPLNSNVRDPFLCPLHDIAFFPHFIYAIIYQCARDIQEYTNSLFPFIRLRNGFNCGKTSTHASVLGGMEWTSATIRLTIRDKINQKLPPSLFYACFMVSLKKMTIREENKTWMETFLTIP